MIRAWRCGAAASSTPGLKAARDRVIFQLIDPGQIDAASEAVDDLDPEAEIDGDSDGAFQIVLTEEAVEGRRLAAVNQSIEIIRRRIDETGVREPTIQRQGEDRILVQLPGVDDPERIKRLLGKTAKLTFHLLDENVTAADRRSGRVPLGSLRLPSDELDANGEEVFYVIRKRVMVSGDSLVDAATTRDQTGQWAVSFRFDSTGARKFGEVTTENVGRPFAIVLDGRVISAPVIREPIVGGNGQITGNFTVEEANDLSLLLRAGALPAPMKILEERTVGPDLGADSIEAGKIACIIGLAAVILFMALYYGLFGLVADLALVLNLIIMLGVLSLLQATLTLPGIAGIVLTIGMAVDANVLIFRANTRGGARRPGAVLGHGGRLSPRLHDDHRLEPDDADCRHHPLRHRHRSGEGLRRHARDRDRHLHVHRHAGEPDDPGHLAPPAAARDAAAVGAASCGDSGSSLTRRRSRSCGSAAPSSSSRSRWRCSRSPSCWGAD